MLNFLAIDPNMTVVVPMPVVWAVVAVLAALVGFTVLKNRKNSKAEAAVAAPAAAPAPVAAPAGPRMAPGSAGKIKLHNVEPKAAAMVMAIVADKLQKPLNELRFISIKEV